MSHTQKTAALLLFFCILLSALCGCSFQINSRPERPAPTTEPMQSVSATLPTTVPTEIPAEQTEPAAEPLPEIEPEITAAPDHYDTVPLYYQTDYPFIKYGNGSIGTSGCSLTCLAMVATYMTDHPYLPDELVYHFGSYGKNTSERLEYAAEQLGLPFEKNFNWRQTQQALAEGKIAIIMENEQSDFTTEQHFIVLSGLTDDGKYLVKDPYEPNYSNELLEDGFFNGFEEYTIIKGYFGGWVFDKSALPQDHVLFDASKPEMQETRYVGYELPEEDVYELACFAWVHARNEPEDVQQAVLEVLLNRLVSQDYPNMVHSVIYSSEMYRNMDYADPGMPQYRAVTAAMYGPYQLPINVYSYSPGPSSGDIWGTLGSFTFLYS